LFRPATDATKSAPPVLDEIAPEDFGHYVRPMLSQDKFEDKIALTGIGMSDIGRRLMVSPLSLTVQACEAAIADAGLTMADIDGLSTYPGSGNVGGFGEGGVTALEAGLGIRPTWYNGGGETFGPGGSVIGAMLAVAGGLARHVLCFRTLWEATYSELMKQGKITPPDGGRTTSWMYPFGATSAAHTLAQNAQRHFDRYGTTRETLGWIALNQRANAELNPTAIYRTPMTMDDYLGSRTITTPFGLYDCDVPCDGAVAVIVSAVEAAGDLAKPPIRVEAVGTQIIERIDWDQSTLTHEPQVLGQSAHLWSRTSLRPENVDVAELYDGFTMNCLSWIEGLGFCGIGEAKDFLDGGTNIARDGVLPLNTHGGQLSHGRTHGMGLLHEAISQLRGEAGPRQVSDAKIGVVSSGGLTPSGVLLLRTET
jgi:acetyl-CoA acetyltransferase